MDGFGPGRRPCAPSHVSVARRGARSRNDRSDAVV